MTPLGASRDNLDLAIAGTEPHLVPVLEAVRDMGLALMFVPQTSEPFRIPRNAKRPTLTVIGDDFDEALGPQAFHAPSLRRVILASRSFTLVSSGPDAAVYGTTAALAAVGRINALLIETRIEQEIAWLTLLQKFAPGRPVLLSTVEGGRA